MMMMAEMKATLVEVTLTLTLILTLTLTLTPNPTPTPGQVMPRLAVEASWGWEKQVPTFRP